MFFRDLIGHELALLELSQGIRDERLPHAILFAGKRGVGKATAAAALAATLLCEKQVEDACGACASCKAFASGNHADFELVKRLEGKRDIGIPQVRELIDTMHRKSNSGRGRVVLIDGAERMTNAAQNAFLKTLEEPPAKTHIILVTAVAERMLPTVRSRCAILRFGSLSLEQMELFEQSRAVSLKGLPLSLAGGSPGQLLRLTDVGLVDARDLVLGLITRPQQISPFVFAASLIECASVEGGAGDSDKDAREILSDRLLLSIRLLALALRDCLVLAEGADQVPLFHQDRREELLEASGRNPAFIYAEAMDDCDSAILDIRRNVDKALALEDLAQKIAKRESPSVIERIGR